MDASHRLRDKASKAVNRWRHPASSPARHRVSVAATVATWAAVVPSAQVVGGARSGAAAHRRVEEEVVHRAPAVRVDRMARMNWRPLAFAFLVLPSLAWAQNEEDALRISQMRSAGTGRSRGLAKAYGALRADPASISINPADFGLYRTGDISHTPGIEVNDATNTFYGTKATDTQSRFFAGNLAMVLHNPAKEDGEWRSSTYGVVYDRQATHHWRRSIRGESVPSTFLEGLAQDAQGIAQWELYDALPFSAGLAWETWAIDPDPLNDTLTTRYQGAIPFGSATDQRHTIESRGATNTTSFFYSG